MGWPAVDILAMVDHGRAATDLPLAKGGLLRLQPARDGDLLRRSL
jgi:hypothetical protein